MKLILDTELITGFLNRQLARRKVRIAAVLTLTLGPLVGLAVTKPHTFADGNTISAAQVNANFDAIFGAVTGLEGFRDTAPRTCSTILSANSNAGDGLYWIDPDGAGGLRPFQAVCDMSGGGWTRVNEVSHYSFAIHTEGERNQPYVYDLTNQQIAAIRAASTQGRQEWQCQTFGVGSVYTLLGNDGSSVPFNTCYAPDNVAYVSSSGSHSTFAHLPFREWRSLDCGDVTEACQHNVGPAFFR